MWSLAWPWALLALPLPFLVRYFVPEARGLSQAGLRVPSVDSFATLKDRSVIEVAILGCCTRVGLACYCGSAAGTHW